ncbi:hypothetical protein [Microbulbifer sp. YPW16]|uniref:hypothetical protein n=1 Tax=Microbulbifer sp. YPW16 TaxID=2904242 RepID=UPI001E367BCF|nr:hypothetical protein [Microbulbifer sp. YPW16]UHQ56638.1 hypothetical protein LVE68_06630 [Microbulbifer sp. YPW16]
MKPVLECVPAAMARHYRLIMGGEDGEFWEHGEIKGAGAGCGLRATYGRPKSELAPVITKLCTNPEMVTVWRHLRRAFAKLELIDWETGFFQYVLMALYDRSPWDYATPGEREDSHADITKKLNELVALLRKFELDHPVWNLMRPLEFEAAIKRHFYTGFTPAYSEPGGIEGRREPSLFLCGNRPYVSEVLERLRQRIAEERVHERALVQKNSSPHGPEYLIVTRRLGVYFTRFLGSPQYGTVRKLVWVLLGVDVSMATVRDTVGKSPCDKEGIFYMPESTPCD